MHSDFSKKHDKNTIAPKTLSDDPLDSSEFAAPEAAESHDDGNILEHLDLNMPSNKRHKRSFKQWLKARTKKQWIIFGIITALVLAGIGAALFFFVLKNDKPQGPKVVVHKVAKKPPTTVQSKLTGLQVPPAFNERQVTAIMIENSQDARPQAGLSEAGVVFEAIAEGGITRFLTLWQDTEPEYVGPVRSVRPYYIQWLMGFDGAVAHVGGSGDALAMLRQLGVKDLDQFANPGPYWRVNTRFAPHNMYTSLVKLRALEAQKGWTKSNYTGFARSKAEAPSKVPTAKAIDFSISSATFNPHYDYDSATNSYKRSEGGAAHLDDNTKQQLAPKVVVALVMPQSNNGIYTVYNTLGTGAAYVFQNGTVTIGTWTKNSNSDQFVFKKSDGTTLNLIPGQTWLSVVGSADKIKYTP